MPLMWQSGKVAKWQIKKRLNFAEPAIEVKLWEEAENVWYCTHEEKYGMNWDAVPDDISHDKEKCEACIKEQDDRERAFVLEYLNAHGHHWLSASLLNDTGKGCLERQPSSVPFIVQYESRNNQVHFTGCKVRKNF